MATIMIYPVKVVFELNSMGTVNITLLKIGKFPMREQIIYPY
jgi:hypothetical protein